jgi:hypothetical protein
MILMCHYILSTVAYLVRFWIHGFSLTHFFLAIASFRAGAGHTGIPLELLFMNPRVLPRPD